jgi:hypothetical protein
MPLAVCTRLGPHEILAPIGAPASAQKHKLPAGYRVMSTLVLGGLSHEYRLEREVA